MARVPLVIESISRDEVLRYLGHHGQELAPELDERIDAAIARCVELASPRASLASYLVARRGAGSSAHDASQPFVSVGSGVRASTCDHREETLVPSARDHREEALAPLASDHREEALAPLASDHREETLASAPSDRTEPIALVGCTLRLAGRDIARHLSDASEVVLLAVTLGADVDRELRRLSLTDPAAQVLFDAAATALVEAAADAADARARAYAFERGLYPSARFSPGYGDLPLDCQSELLAALDATRQLGITLTPSRLMVPTKSVSALVGIHPTPQAPSAPSCAICSLAPHCTLRAQGRSCRSL